MLNRRKLMTTAGASMAAILLARSIPVIAQTKPLRIGTLISHTDSQGQDELIHVDCDLDQIEEVRKVWQFFRDRRPETYGDMTEQLP